MPSNNATLTELGDTLLTDKSVMRWPHHGYTYTYDMLFQNLREEKVSILELGLAKTSQDYRGRSEQRSNAISPSVEMWLRYFPYGHVTGFDLSDFHAQESDRFTFVQGDLGKQEDYTKISSLNCKYNVIVDDGSHASFHQMLAFINLFPLLKDGGYFVIEDLISQPAVIEKSHPTSHTMSELLREFVRLGYFPNTNPIENDKFNALLGSINNIFFVPYHNNGGADDQLVVIHKKEGSRFHHYRSKIRFFKTKPEKKHRISLEQQIDADEYNPYSFYWLARLFFDEANYETAWLHIDRASSLQPDDYEITALKCMILFEKGMTEISMELAISKMVNAIAVDAIGHVLVKYLLNIENHRLAQRLLDHMLNVNPHSSLSHYLNGLSKELSTKFKESAICFKNACDILPSKLMYLKAYCRVSRKINDKSSFEYAKNRNYLFNDKCGYHILLAQNAFKFGRFEEAEQELFIIIDRFPGNEKWADKFQKKIRHKRL